MLDGRQRDPDLLRDRRGPETGLECGENQPFLSRGHRGGPSASFGIARAAFAAVCLTGRPAIDGLSGAPRPRRRTSSVTASANRSSWASSSKRRDRPRSAGRERPGVLDWRPIPEPKEAATRGPDSALRQGPSGLNCSKCGSPPSCQKTSRRLCLFPLGVPSMSKPKHPPGSIRDAILGFLTENAGDASVEEIRSAVEQTIGSVPPSSVRSYLRLRPDIFERTVRGRYQIADGSRTVPFALPDHDAEPTPPTYTHGKATLYQADSFQWMANRKPNSIHAVVTDPPYGLVEYSEKNNSNSLTGRAVSGGSLPHSTATYAPHFQGLRR